MILHAGAVIAGRYRLQRKIGSGGMGEVWAAEHIAIGVRVALKALLPAAAMDQQLVARFRREAYLLGRLRSDRVARVVDFVEDRRFGLVLVMDFVEGDPLANVLEMRRLNVEESIALGIDIVTALCDLHRAKVVHRDLKPDNIILEPLANGKTRAVIVDFGVSRLESSGDASNEEESITGITQADVAVGTIPYMAPEQFLSSRDVTGAADLYAVGAILFRALSGQHVYGDTEDLDYAKIKITTRAPPLHVPRFDRVGRGFSAIVAKALERLPDDRFESADAMLAELLALSDLARATALDLDAATEQALPTSSLVGDDIAEATRRMSRPPDATDDMLDELTLESPTADPPTESSPPPPMDPPSLASTPAPATSPRYTVPSPGMGPREAALHDTLVDATAPSATIAPAPRPPRTFTPRALVAAIVAALIAGALLGFELRALIVR